MTSQSDGVSWWMQNRWKATFGSCSVSYLPTDQVCCLYAVNRTLSLKSLKWKPRGTPTYTRQEQHNRKRGYCEVFIPYLADPAKWNEARDMYCHNTSTKRAEAASTTKSF